MPRPPRCRRICCAPQYESFSPEYSQEPETVTLTLDEYEVIRLVDLERKTHEQCAAQMDISRTTVTEIYDYLRLLYARVGVPHCPECGREIKKQTTDQVTDEIMRLAASCGITKQDIAEMLELTD